MVYKNTTFLDYFNFRPHTSFFHLSVGEDLNLESLKISDTRLSRQPIHFGELNHFQLTS
jgi:hypothetical protein